MERTKAGMDVGTAMVSGSVSKADEILVSLSEARNAVAYREGELKQAQADTERALRPYHYELARAQDMLRDIEEELFSYSARTGETSWHNDSRHFTATVTTTRGMEVVNEAEVIAAFTEKGIPVPYQKPKEPALNKTRVKQIARGMHELPPGIVETVVRTVRVVGDER
jgi:hypothetical protein